MIRTARLLVWALAMAIALPLAGCIHHEHHHPARVVVRPDPPGHGPPPHAPAHGYRHKHRDGVELVYDSGMGVYVVVGWNDIWFHRDHYLRLRGGEWQRAAQLRGPWRDVSARVLPPGLRRGASAVHPHSRKRGKGHGAAKPAW